jgi:tetratricopeptide (TPR) repeat protein
MGDLQRAIEDYTAAIEIDPSEPDYYASRGADYGMLGRTSESLADFEYAVELDPMNPKFLFYRGLAYGAIGEVEAAVADLELVLEMGVPPDLETYIRDLLADLQP